MITIDNRQVMVEHYTALLHVAADEIRLQMKQKILIIKGNQLSVLALSKYEIIIEGNLEGVIFEYET